ncbi:MAG: O-antigen ligase family protein [Chloroflexi bacterium]|nr:O-antigen ligase family protein [Chloroflexota bacterium]
MIRRYFAPRARFWFAAFIAGASLAAILAVLLLSPGQALWVTPLLVLFAYLSFRSEGRFWRRSPADWLLALLFVSTFLAWLFSPAPDSARQALAYIVAGGILFWAVLIWGAGPMRISFLLGMILLVTTLLAAISPLLVDAGKVHLSFFPGWLLAVGRRIPETVNPNVISGALAAWLPVSISLAWRPVGETRRSRRWMRALALATFFASIFILVIFRTRGVWVAAPLALGLAVLLRWPRGWAAVPIVFAGIWALATGNGPFRLDALIFQDDPLGGMAGRLEIWASALQALRDFPLSGIGLGAWNEVIPLFYPYRSLALLAPGVEIPHAHNLFLQIGLDIGLPGLVAYAALWGLCVWMALQAHKRFAQHQRLAWASLAFSVVIGLLIIALHGLIDSVAWGTKSSIWTWLLFGMATLLYLEAE